MKVRAEDFVVNIVVVQKANISVLSCPYTDFVKKVTVDMDVKSEQEAFRWFLRTAVRIVVRKKHYDTMIGHEVLSNWITTSDEAFAFLIVEKVIHNKNWTEIQAAKKGGGWNKEGLDRFNKLYDLVEAERKTERRLKEEAEFLEYNKAKQENKGRKRKHAPDTDSDRKKWTVKNDW